MGSNGWESEVGKNLTFSLAVDMSFLPAERQFLLSEAVPLGIVEMLDKLLPPEKLSIKWPNDIYVEDRKICGILIEHGISGEMLSSSVCGIGLNINQKEFPKDLPNPTSLIKELKEGTPDFSLTDELEILVSEIYRFYDRAKEEFAQTGKFDSLYNQYLDKLYRKNEFHRYIETEGNKEVEARIIGLSDTACIVLEYRDGSRKTFAFKEISYII